MPDAINRRQFLEASAASSVALGAAATAAGEQPAKKESPRETIVVGVMGVNGRGAALARGFAQQKNAEVAYVCDVDSRAVEKVVAAAGDSQPRKPQGVGDFRKILDDPSVDALVIATPDHWHAPATILACAAGKHVYVEKPCSHNAHEGELMVAAARNHKRVVQMGTQRRSYTGMIAAMKKIHDGELGRVLYSKSWYNNRRGSMGKGNRVAVPAWLDYKLWQGPAPERPFQDNVVHYKWHWLWNWGTGELGNNGVHSIDLSRWGMQVDYPTRVTSAGGRYRYDDDQQTPDTHVVTFEFGERAIGWECRSWSPRGDDGTAFGVAFYGDRATMILTDSSYKLYDMQNKQTGSGSIAGGGDAAHLADFLDCVRNGKRPHQDIEEGHKTTLLCHLGNIAHRVGRSLNTDPKNGHIQDDRQAQALWSREYQQGWEPKV